MSDCLGTELLRYDDHQKLDNFGQNRLIKVVRTQGVQELSSKI